MAVTLRGFAASPTTAPSTEWQTLSVNALGASENVNASLHAQAHCAVAKHAAQIDHKDSLLHRSFLLLLSCHDWH